MWSSQTDPESTPDDSSSPAPSEKSILPAKFHIVSDGEKFVNPAFSFVNSFNIKENSLHHGFLGAQPLKPFAIPKTAQYLLRSVTLSVVLGSITDQKTDILVNSTEFFIDPRRAVGVNKVISAAAGPSYIEQYNASSLSSKQEGVMTPSFDLEKASAIFSIVASHFLDKPTLDENLQGIRLMVHAILKAADLSEYKSVTLPFVGTGATGVDPASAIRCIVEEIIEYSKQPSPKLKNIILCDVEREKVVTARRTVAEKESPKLELAASEPKIIYQWQWMDDKGEWVNYVSYASKKISEEYHAHNGRGRADVVIPKGEQDEAKYTIDFTKNMQISKATGFERAIRKNGAL